MSRRGFTLVELLVVVAIISILSVIAVLNYQDFLKRGRDAKRQADLGTIQSTLEMYRADQGYYPNDISSLLSSGGSLTNCTGSGVPSCNASRTYLNNVPQDPTGSPHYCYVSQISSTNSGPCDNQPANTCGFYTLHAKLEKLLSGSTPCLAVTTYNFKITPP